MPKHGLMKLPIGIPIQKALNIMEILPSISRKMERLEERFQNTIVSDPLVQLLSLNESVESTRIEDTQVTFTDMVEAQHNHHSRWEVIEIQNYQNALMYGFERVQNGYPISFSLIKDLHHILMEGVRGTEHASGEYRKIQNFIGPTNKIEDTSYIPVSAEKIDNYMENLEYFINFHPYDGLLSVNHLNKDEYVFNEHSVLQT